MKKFIFVLLIAVLTFMGSGKSYAHDIEVANADGVTIYYNYINNKTELEVTYKGYSDTNADYAGNVVIPESVTYEGNAYPVTSIGNSAFLICSDLTELTIPNSVTSIGDAAFYCCYDLTEVAIPNSVTSIGNWAFHYCMNLTELTIPGSVTSIGYNPFRRCSGLEKITVESSNPNYDSRENCNAIIETNSNKLITGCKNTIILNSVTTIGEQAFAGCSGLMEVTIPNSVTSIGERAFYNCSGLTEVTIPNSVTSIGNSAFWNCADLERVTIGNSVASIGDEAFDYCYWLKTVYSLNTTPPSISTSTFNTYNYMDVDFFVPEEALEAYRTAEVWKDFERLQAINGSAAVTEVSANAEQIQTANGQITVTGLIDGTTVTVYDLSGQQVGQATSKGGQTTVNTNLTSGSTAIVKMGERSVKTVMK